MSDRCRTHGCLAEALPTSRYCVTHASAETIPAALTTLSEASPEELHREIGEEEETLGGFTAESRTTTGDEPKVSAVTPDDAERDPRMCSHRYDDGSMCKGWKAGGTPWCMGHAGRIGGKPQSKSSVQAPQGLGSNPRSLLSAQGNGSAVSDEARVRTRLYDLAFDSKTPAAAAVAAGRAFLDKDYADAETPVDLPVGLFSDLTIDQHVAVLDAQPDTLGQLVSVLVAHGRGEIDDPLIPDHEVSRAQSRKAFDEAVLRVMPGAAKQEPTGD